MRRSDAPLPYTAAGVVVVAANPYSGVGANRRRVEALDVALRALGAAPRLLWDADERAAVLADRSVMRGCRAVIVAGGDGTVTQVINELPPGVPLAILPLGNENLLAGALGFGLDVGTLARAIVAGRTRLVDLGRASGAAGSRLFALMLSAGFDAAVVHRLAAWRGAGSSLRRVRRASYLAPIASCLLAYRHAAIALATEGVTCHGALCVVANFPAYALDLRLTPSAVADDGRLDWLVFQRPGVGPLVRYSWAAYRGRHLARPDVTVGQATRILIGGQAPVQLDGDAWGTTPVEVTAVPAALTVIAGS